MEGDALDRHGYLVDIVELNDAVSGVISDVAERTLNEFPPFAGLNPSLEHFSRIFWDMLVSRIRLHGKLLTVKLWENEAERGDHRIRVDFKCCELFEFDPAQPAGYDLVTAPRARRVHGRRALRPAIAHPTVGSRLRCDRIRQLGLEHHASGAPLSGPGCRRAPRAPVLHACRKRAAIGH
ncbi:MAG: 6-pyruvoyl trahydropterin synthase family protein [Burkholderiales bacterium]